MQTEQLYYFQIILFENFCEQLFYFQIILFENFCAHNAMWKLFFI